MRPATIVLPVAFAAFGVLWGAWQSVLPDLAGHYGLSTGPLGAMLTAGFAVSLPVMIGTGRFVDRFGAGWGMAVPAAAMASSLLAIATLPPMAGLVAGVIGLAAGSGAYDVAINGAAMGDATWSRPGGSPCSTRPSAVAGWRERWPAGWRWGRASRSPRSTRCSRAS